MTTLTVFPFGRQTEWWTQQLNSTSLSLAWPFQYAPSWKDCQHLQRDLKKVFKNIISYHAFKTAFSVPHVSKFLFPDWNITWWWDNRTSTHMLKFPREEIFSGFTLWLQNFSSDINGWKITQTLIKKHNVYWEN